MAAGPLMRLLNTLQVSLLAIDENNPAASGQVGRDSAGNLLVFVGGAVRTLSSTNRTITAGAGLTGGGDLSADRTINAVANADGSIVVNADDIQVGVISDAQHGTRGGGTQHAVATTSVAGFMSAADKASVNLITPEGGYCIWLTNKTGGASVKGTVVVASAGTDTAFDLAGVGADDAFGIVYDAGIADGSPCRVVIAGLADVLVEAADVIARKNWVRTATATAGRASMGAVVGGGSVAEHFLELGHCLETKVNGGNTLAKCVLHFN